IAGKGAYGFRARQQGRAGAFIDTPGPGGRHMHRRVRMHQALVISVQKIAALGFRDMAGKIAPGLRRQLAQAIEKPIYLRLPAKEDAAECKSANAIGMELGISDGERRAPGATEHGPFVDPEMLTQPLDVGHQVRGRVVADLAERPRATGTPLIEDDDAV